MVVFTLTTGGVTLAKRLKDYYPAMEIYTSEKLIDKDLNVIEPSFKACVEEQFQKEAVIIFIMASGIVVRTIAPFLKHKKNDPGILVMDEKGQFVISLVSGHLGKANEWAAKIASSINGTPVITTASDVNGLLAVDMLAEKLNCGITDYTAAKDVTALLVNGKKVGIQSSLNVRADDFKDYVIVHRYDENLDIDGLAIISEQAPNNIDIPYVWLVPRNLTVGIGCKRGKSAGEIKKALVEVLEMMEQPIEAVKAIASVDVKADEEGLITLAKTLRVPFIIVTRDEIKEVEGLFNGSEFVKKTIGVTAVSEPCGYIASNKGKCLVERQKKDGITISVWQ